MRKSFKWIFAAVVTALAVIGCAKQGDLDKISERVDGIENRVGALENAVKQLNEQDVPSLKTLVSALQRQITISSIVEDEEGYTITFSDGTIAVLRNGKNGKDGQDGVDGVDGVNGVDGVTPTVGITLLGDVYVWTVNGNILRDENGNPFPVSGNDGKDGKDGVDGTDGNDGSNGTDGKDGITPQFGILDGHWVVSYDNGETWKTLGLTSDTDYSAYIDPDKETDDYIVLVVGATEVQIPKEKAFTLKFTVGENNGVDAGATKTFPYTVEGVNPTDEIDVDVIGIMGDWTADIVPSNNAAGGLKVTAGESASAKITVYAANHKGKTDIRTLVFEAGVLEAIYETKDIDWEGGELDLAVKTNQTYHIFIPAAAEDWLTVEPVTRVYVDNYKISVDKNETGSYRTATLQLLNSTGKVVKNIEVVQYANPAVPTDLASVVALPDDKPVLVNGVTVVAASKVSTIVTDGKAFAYVSNYVGTPGTVINVTGTKKTDEIGAAYLDATEITVDAEAEPAQVDKKASYLYYGYGKNGYSFFYTANNGVVSEQEGVYYVTGFADPQRFVIEDPAQDLSGLVGKMVAMSGWVKAVDTAEGAEDIVTVLTDIHEVVWAQEAGWKPYYGGKTSGDASYPEVIGNEVSNPEEGSYYSLKVYNYATVATQYETLGDFIMDACYNTSDDLLFDITYYGRSGYDYDEVFSVFAHNESAADTFADFGYGQFIIVAVGLDEEARLSGKFAVAAFEKESPYAKAAYEDFLGEWTYTSDSGSETWLIEEKVKGESYKITGISGVELGGGVYPVAEYDATNGCFTLSNQYLGDWTYSGIPLTDYLVAVWYSGSKYYDNSKYMTDPLICTGYIRKADGKVEIVESSDSYGPLEGMAFFGDGGEAGTLNYGASTKIPGILEKASSELDPAYAKWLGNWNVDRQKKVLSNGEWVTEGEPVTDTWTIATKTPNKTFTITGMYGRNYTVEAKFDAASGAISVACQEGVGTVKFTNMDYTCDVVALGSVLRPDGNYRITGNYTIFKASLSGDDAGVITPGTVKISSWGDDPVAVSLFRFWGKDPEKGTYYYYDGEVFLNLPNTMKRAAAGSSVNYASDVEVALDFADATAAYGSGELLKLSATESAPVREMPAVKDNGRKNFGDAFPMAVKF